MEHSYPFGQAAAPKWHACKGVNVAQLSSAAEMTWTVAQKAPPSFGRNMHSGAKEAKSVIADTFRRRLVQLATPLGGTSQMARAKASIMPAALSRIQIHENRQKVTTAFGRSIHPDCSEAGEMMRNTLR